MSEPVIVGIVAGKGFAAAAGAGAIKIPLQYLNLALAINGVGMTKH